MVEAALYHEKIVVTMWHPEREMSFQEADIARVRKLFECVETEKQ